MTAAKSMQCPRCRSQYTQSVEMAYSQAIRTGESGYTTISEFGRSLEPPAPRSEVGYPLAVTLAVGLISMVSLPALGEQLPFEWSAGMTSFDVPVVIASVLLGLVAGVWSAASAMAYNMSVHSDEIDEWERGVVCRRCGHRFGR
jgi:DNA-directed RNA polymerase subunit RPC12/RpoP